MATTPTSIETNGAPPPQFVWPQWLRGRWGALGLAAVAYAVIFAVWTFFHWGGEDAKAVISDIAYLPLSLFGALTCSRRTRPARFKCASTSPPMRRR